jgi:NADPH:quinone reductase-like Zn-dependent oxidoreductase
MRAAVLHAYDEPPRAEEFEDPPHVGSGDGRVVAEVRAAGLNPIDLTTASGILPAKPPLPSVVGKEAIAIVDGRRVYFDTPVPPFGSMAERALVDGGSLIDVPDDVDDGLAVSLGIAGLAAWLGLQWRGELREGEKVVVLGASGVVGRLAVQTARLLGAATVVAAARDAETLERAQRELGADAAVDLSDTDGLADRYRDAAGGDVDLVLDAIWGPAAAAAIAALRPSGRLVQVGNASGATTEIAARDIRTGIRSILGHTNFAAPQGVKREAFQAMCRHAAAGELTVPVQEVALADIEQAWRRQAEGPHHKLVVRPG